MHLASHSVSVRVVVKVTVASHDLCVHSALVGVPTRQAFEIFIQPCMPV